MSCNYVATKLERVASTLLVPIAIALLGWFGSCTANNIAQNNNKATILKEFLPILLKGSSGEKIVARIALRPYLTEGEWKELDWGLRLKLEDVLLNSFAKDDLRLGVDAATSYKALFPNSFERLTHGQLKQGQETSLRPLLDDSMRTESGKNFFDKVFEAAKKQHDLDGQLPETEQTKVH